MLQEIKDHSALVDRIINNNIKEYEKILERNYLLRERRNAVWQVSKWEFLNLKKVLKIKNSSFKSCLNIQIPILITHNNELNAWQLHSKSNLYLTFNHLNISAAQPACW